MGGDSCATGLPNGTLHNTGQMCSFFKGHVTLNETVRLSETRGSVQTAAGPGFIGVFFFVCLCFLIKRHTDSVRQCVSVSVSQWKTFV